MDAILDKFVRMRFYGHMFHAPPVICLCSTLTLGGPAEVPFARHSSQVVAYLSARKTVASSVVLEGAC